ncbi:DUF421 domain-containing protein [Halobacillus mangrovi]|uniref:DUF421 domain-containing protein n=1 Tax=Halobacillus mangrovi TaxID=402384 RepID=UPI003D96B9ED
MEDIIQVVSRSLGSFVLLVVVTLFTGKHINAHKNYYSFALSITIGSFIANMGFNTKLNFFEMATGFLALIFMFYLLLFLAAKSRRLRSWISGQPTVVMEGGKILEDNMKKIKFSLDDLNQHLREFGIFDINEVDDAMVEVSGELSIRKKNQFQPVTKKDLNLSSSPGSLPIELIMNGRMIRKNFSDYYNDSWIKTELKTRSLNIEDVHYAVVNSNGILFIDTYQDHIESPSDIE